jgi:hypothetical protein
MIDFFNKIYSSINNKKPFPVKYNALLLKALRITANIVLPIYFRLSANNPNYALKKNTQSDKPKVIVSLTSIPIRINRLWLAVETILRQTHKPDKIILWLSNEQFPDIKQLPKRLLDLCKRGLEIELKDNDLKSHKKYYYAIKEYPHDILITIDDDILYPSNMIKNLIDAHNIYPNSVIARYGRRIKVDPEGIMPYNEWEMHYITEIPDTFAFFGSGGGTLFPLYSLPSITKDKEVFMKICPLADDVWLNSMIRLNNRYVYMLEANKEVFLPIINFNNVTLASKNLDENLNDRQINDVRYYLKEHCNIDPFRDVLV